MMAEPITLAKACMDFFQPPKLTTIEYRELTRKDREELREMFISAGWDIAPLPAQKTEA